MGWKAGFVSAAILVGVGAVFYFKGGPGSESAPPAARPGGEAVAPVAPSSPEVDAEERAAARGSGPDRPAPRRGPRSIFDDDDEPRGGPTYFEPKTVAEPAPVDHSALAEAQAARLESEAAARAVKLAREEAAKRNQSTPEYLAAKKKLEAAERRLEETPAFSPERTAASQAVLEARGALRRLESRE